MGAKKRFNINFDTEEEVLVKRLIGSTVGIILVLIFVVFGLQFFGPRVFSIFGLLSLDRLKKSSETKFQTQVPIFTDTIKATKNKTINLNGLSESNSKVKLFVNGPQTADTKADSDGKFSFSNVELIEGPNTIFAKAEGENKTESEKSETLSVVYDIKKPEVIIISPKDGENLESVDSRINVKGKVNEQCSVSINSHMTIVDSEGNFQSLISVKEGNNKIIVTATDLAGNQSTAAASINFDKR